MKLINPIPFTLGTILGCFLAYLIIPDVGGILVTIFHINIGYYACYFLNKFNKQKQ